MNDFIFSNNNCHALKRLAQNDLKFHKLATILSACIIVLSTSLMAVIFTVLINDALSQTNSAPYHAMYRSVNAKVQSMLSSDDDFETVGFYKNLGCEITTDGRTDISYMDASTLTFMGFHILNGTLPQKEQEVLVSKRYLNMKHLSVGDTFDFSYVDAFTHKERTYNFTICGTIENKSQESGKQFCILCSDEFRIANAQSIDASELSQFSTQSPDSIDVLVLLNADKNKMSALDKEDFLKEKGLSLGLESFNIILNTRYIEGFTLEGSVLIGIILFSLFLMFASSFVIYSIFYISVVSSIQMYAQLISLGTTKKQLQQFLRIQGNILSYRFITIGMLLSLLLCILMSGTKWLMYDIPIILFSGLLIFIVIKFALRKPAKILSSISPIEGMKYTGSITAKKHKILKHITPITLAKNNLTVHKRKNRMSIVSLSISGSLMISLTILIFSINLPAMLLQSFPLNEDFQLGIQMDNFYERFPLVIQNNPLAGEIETEIQSLPGVTKIVKDECLITRLVDPKIMFDTPEDNVEILNSLSDELLSNVSELVSGSLDYNDIGSNGIVLNKYRSDRSNINYNDLKVGDSLSFEFDVDGNTFERSLKIVGIAYFPSTGLFYTTPAVIQSISPYDNISHLSIFCDKESRSAVKESLENLVSGNPDLNLKIYADEYTTIKRFVRVTMNSLYGICAFVIIFGLLNMINMLINSAISRKKEFALLQAVGMTNSQLRQMLYSEGIHISLRSACIATVAGILLGRLFCYLANEVMSFKFILFTINIWPLLTFVVILIGLQMIISYLICRTIEKSTITERLRTE